jgi:chitobiase/beta-hexosaminidase-like protein/Big-like domain-containing protein
MKRFPYFWICIRTATISVTLLALALVATIAEAANGSVYVLQATDPHGEIWLNGSLGGHLWLADVIHGFCRLDVDPSTGAVTISSLTNACAHPGQKPSQPTLDPIPNADGTFYVYTCDWATQSQGCYRMTYSPLSETISLTELLAPGRFPTDIKPFATTLGPADHKLYVSSDLNASIYRYTAPNDPSVGNQAVEVVGASNDGKRIRAITFACWDPLRAQRGLPSCSQMAANGDAAPDLVIAQTTTVDVILNAETCQTTAVGCPALATPLLVTSPMGLYTQSGRPDVIYVTDSPATTSQIIRYTISTNVQDSYSNFGTLPDGTLAQYSFMFSITMASDGTMYAGDDPSAGATSFNGRIWRIPAGAPADALGSPGMPAPPPPPPAVKTSFEYGTGVTLPNDGVWMGSHLWMADGAAGFCRVDVNPSTGMGSLNGGTCSLATKQPGQPAFDSVSNLVYLPDATSKSVGVIRLQFDPAGSVCGAPETVCNPVTLAPGLGLDGQRADAAAIDPTTGTLYVAFLARNSTAPAQIARILNPSGPVANQTVEFVANTTRQRPVYGLGFIGGDLWVGDNGGVEWLPNIKTCQAGGCGTVLVLNMAGPRGFATDGKRYLYLAAPVVPLGGTLLPPGSITTVVQRFDTTTGDVFPFSSTAIFPDGTTGPYWVVDSLALDPVGNLFIADDPNSAGLPVGQGRVFEINSGGQLATVAITSKPGNPTNNTRPSFGFSSAQPGVGFQCSLTPSGGPDAYAPCASPAAFGPLADGSYTFKVIATNSTGATTSAPAAYTFSVDTQVPVVTITSAPASPTNSTTPLFSFSATKTVSFQCALTTAATPTYSPCGSGPETNGSTSYPAPADGAYTFSVIGTDAAGNLSQPATRALTIDTVAPLISASPPPGLYASAQSVSLNASEPATIHYTLDGTTPTLASPVYSAPVTISGNTTLSYFGVDQAGNVSSIAFVQYQIGSLRISSTPASPTNNNRPTFSFASPLTDATYQCSLSTSSAVFTACTSPVSYPAQADATYTFTVQGFDPTGASIGTASTRLVIDTVAPAVPLLTQNPSNPSGNSSAVFGFTSEAGASFKCSLVLSTAAASFAACASPMSYGPLADGTYTFQVTATDQAGNVSQPNVYQFAVAALAPPSTTPPTPALTGLTTALASTSATATNAGPITASTTSVPVVLSWTGTACMSAVVNCNVDHYVLQESVNGGAFTAVALPSPTATSVRVNLKPSPTNNSVPATTYRFQVQAIDIYGHIGTFTSAAPFSVPDTDNAFNSSFAGSWSGVNLTGAFGGSVQQSSVSGATANPSNPQSATSFGVVSTLGPDRGKVQIMVDGMLMATVDLYAPSQTTAQVVWTINGLSPSTTHQIQIVSTGLRNSASTSAKVDYDAILALK